MHIMSFLTAVIVVALSFSGLVYGGTDEFPPEYPRCKFGDTDCLTTTINQYLRMSAKGIPEINLVPIEPFFISSLKVVQGKKNSPVNVQLHFKNSTLNGLSDIIIKKVVGFKENPKTSKFEIYAITNKPVTLIGKYDIKGQVLILPIQGRGDSKISFEDMPLKLTFTFDVDEKDGDTYVKIGTIKFDFDPRKLNINFSNLFNGDKLLGDTMNAFLNENWRGIFDEIKPVLSENLEIIVKNVINTVFSKIPYNKAFLPVN